MEKEGQGEYVEGTPTAVPTAITQGLHGLEEKTIASFNLFLLLKKIYFYILKN